MRTVKLGFIQMSSGPEKDRNIEKVKVEIRKAASLGAQVICLQELFSTLYFCDTENYDAFQFAESVPGPSTILLGQLAKELDVVIVASLFEKRAEGLYHNTAAVLNADGVYLGKYRKMHIPDDPGFYEKFYFTPGDLGYKVFETKYLKIGVLICWDQWYPEAARITALKGAELLVFPTAIGWNVHQPETTNIEQHHAWQTIQLSHSIANGLPVLAINRVGREGDIQFWGGSFLSNSFGTVVYQASATEQETGVLSLDLEQTDRYRTHWPFLRDRRIDSYQEINQRYLD